MAEWFSALVMGLRVRGSSPDRDENLCDLKTLSVHPAANGYLIKFREGSKGSGRRGMGSAFQMLCPGHGGSKQVTAATAYTTTIFFFYKNQLNFAEYSDVLNSLTKVRLRCSYVLSILGKNCLILKKTVFLFLIFPK